MTLKNNPQNRLLVHYGSNAIELLRMGTAPPDLVVALLRTLVLVALVSRNPEATIQALKDGLLEAVALEFDSTADSPAVKQMREIITLTATEKGPEA